MKATYKYIEHLFSDRIFDGNHEAHAAESKALSAIDKQIPKKPTYVDTRFRNHGRHVRDGSSLDKCYKCPSCWSHIFHVFDSEKYCIHCGQALDWGEEDRQP